MPAPCRQARLQPSTLLLQINDGVGVCLSKICRHSLAPLLYYFLEYLVGELLALVMAYDGDLYFLLVPEILVVVHLAGNESVSPFGDGVAEKERTGTAAHGNGLYRAAQQLVALHALNIERALEHEHKVVACHRIGQTAYHSAAAFDTVNRLTGEKSGSPQAPFSPLS